MIVQNPNVELTKVHYYDVNHSGRNLQISTIFREGPRPGVRKNALIKRNVFGHKWVLKINESNDNLKKSRVKLVVYLVVFACIVIAVCFGIFLSIESKFFRNEPASKETPKQVPNATINPNVHRDRLNLSLLHNSYENKSDKVKDNIKLYNDSLKTAQDEELKNVTSRHSLCHICKKGEEICLNIVEGESPKCRKIVDKKDPTGCGGLCKVNKEYCKILDEDDQLYQCRNLSNTLNCSEGLFNCGNRCISNRMRCDGIIHCSNMSDEKNCDCNLSTHFQCSNSTGCLEQWKKCDGNIDCWDSFDETDCNYACSNGEVPCRNGQCIDKEKFCDGTYQCVDKSDEPKGCELHK